jgi:phosphate starvation-inducible PhoH-like protein
MAAAAIAAIGERRGAGAFDVARKRSKIERAPCEVVRTRSRNGSVLLDDAQNATPAELKTPLAHISEDCADDRRRRQSLRARPSLRPGATRAAAPLIKVVLAAIVRSGGCAMSARAFAATTL